MAQQYLSEIPQAPAVLKALGTAEDQQRFANYPDYAQFWNGQQWQGRPRNPADVRLVMNYARSLLRKAVSYTLGDAVHHEIRAGKDAGEDAAQDAENRLAAALELAGADELDHQLLTDALVYGESIAKVTWSTERGAVQLSAIHPNNVIVWADPATRDRPHRLMHGYYMAGHTVAQHFKLPREIEAGSTSRELYPVIEDWTADTWSVSVNGWPVIAEPNPYKTIPYAMLINEPQTGRVWGMSDVVDMVDVCREINSRLSTLSNVLELSGAPIAVFEGVTGTEGITARPGARWELPADARAYLLDLLAGGGVDLHIKAIGEHRQSLHDLSETPRSAFGDAGRQLSGAALEVELQPLVQKVRRKRRALRRFYQRRNELVIGLLEQFGGESYPTRQTAAIFPPILPTDSDSDTRNAVALVSAGIRSRRSAAADLGEQDPSRELDRVLEEAALFHAKQPTSEATSQNSTSSEVSK